MGQQLTADDAKQSLTAHIEAKGVEILCQFGSPLMWAQLEQLIENRAYVRYPCELVFDAAALLPGECAHPLQKGETPEAGFTMYIHPRLADARDRAVYVVLYQLVVVNYGEFASAYEAETFGAAALGLTRDEYYEALCAIADEIGGQPAHDSTHPSGCGCGM